MSDSSPLFELPNEESTKNLLKHYSWKLMVPALFLALGLIAMAYHFNWDAKVVGAGVLLFGFVSGLCAWLVGVVSLVPVVGPLVAKALQLSLVWILNAIGYCVSYIAIKRGYTQDVLTYRGLTTALLVGIVIGFVLGSLV